MCDIKSSYMTNNNYISRVNTVAIWIKSVTYFILISYFFPSAEQSYAR